jgi:hypothetical protein
MQASAGAQWPANARVTGEVGHAWALGVAKVAQRPTSTRTLSEARALSAVLAKQYGLNEAQLSVQGATSELDVLQAHPESTQMRNSWKLWVTCEAVFPIAHAATDPRRHIGEEARLVTPVHSDITSVAAVVVASEEWEGPPGSHTNEMN